MSPSFVQKHCYILVSTKVLIFSNSLNAHIFFQCIRDIQLGKISLWSSSLLHRTMTNFNCNRLWEKGKIQSKNGWIIFWCCRHSFVCYLSITSLFYLPSPCPWPGWASSPWVQRPSKRSGRTSPHPPTASRSAWRRTSSERSVLVSHSSEVCGLTLTKVRRRREEEDLSKCVMITVTHTRFFFFVVRSSSRHDLREPNVCD